MEETCDFETTSMITDEISSFLDDLGLSTTDYEFDYQWDSEDRRYSATAVIKSEDVEDIMAMFGEDREEFAEHLQSTFPDIDVVLLLKGYDSDGYISEEDADEDNFEDINFFSSRDDDDCEDTDSAELQYEEEGLTIMEELDAEDDDGIEGFAGGRPVRVSVEVTEDDEDADIDDETYLDPISSEEDDYDSYSPDPEDMEDLWSAFGVAEDE